MVCQGPGQIVWVDITSTHSYAFNLGKNKCSQTQTLEIHEKIKYSYIFMSHLLEMKLDTDHFCMQDLLILLRTCFNLRDQCRATTLWSLYHFKIGSMNFSICTGWVFCWVCHEQANSTAPGGSCVVVNMLMLLCPCVRNVKRYCICTSHSFQWARLFMWTWCFSYLHHSCDCSILKEEKSISSFSRNFFVSGNKKSFCVHHSDLPSLWE